MTLNSGVKITQQGGHYHSMWGTVKLNRGVNHTLKGIQ